MTGTGVTTYCLEPGLVRSDLQREVGSQCWWKVFVCCWKCCGRRVLTVEEGALTTLYCCLEPSLEHESGLYYGYVEWRKN